MLATKRSPAQTKLGIGYLPVTAFHPSLHSASSTKQRAPSAGSGESEGVATATKTEHDMAHRTLSKQEGKKRTLRTKAVSPEELTVTYGHVTSGLGVFVDKEMDRHEVWMKGGSPFSWIEVSWILTTTQQSPRQNPGSLVN